MTDALVVFDHVSKNYGTFNAVNDISMTVRAGEFLALMGPSGCGKTTTLRMLAGLETPTAGEIRIEGSRMNDVPAHQRDTPMVWQSLALFPYLNVQENVEFGLKMRNIAPAQRRKRATDWLERMEIAEFARRNVAELSGGQRQRVALARALVTEPQILLLDEPLSALDANLVIRMQSVLTRLQKSLGITFVYVTHSQSEAFAMADRVVIMNQGEIAQTGTSRDIYREPGNRFVAEFVGRNNIFDGVVESSDGIRTVIRCGTDTFTVADASASSAAGDNTTFVISADMVTLSVEQPVADNSVLCQVISEEFVGAVVTLFLETAEGVELSAQLQQRELDTLAPQTGKKLWVSWAAENSHLIG